jgi:hypothetical protein
LGPNLELHQFFTQLSFERGQRTLAVMHFAAVA